jgi:hypothetical protein
MKFDERHYIEAIKRVHSGDERMFIESYLMLASKQNELVPFRLNRLQQYVAQTSTGRDYYLKYRQGGSSVYQLAKRFVRAICIPNYDAVIVTLSSDGGKTAQAQFSIVERFLKHLPAEIRPEPSHTAHGESLEFDNGSRISVSKVLAGELGRGRTINDLMVTELGSFSPKDAQVVLTSAIESVPPTGEIVFETTPKFVGSPAHAFYMDCKAGRKPYRAFFLPWWYSEDYHLPEGSNAALQEDKGRIVMTDEERRIAEQFLDDGIPVDDRIRWRRAKIADRGNDFYAEYPEDELNCWLSVSAGIFPSDKIRWLLSIREKPIYEDATIRVYREPAPERNYVIGIDAAGGIPGGDYSAGVVLCVETGEVAAVLHGHMAPLEFARRCAETGVKYNRAQVGGERDAWTTQVMAEMERIGYSELYRHDDGKAYMDIGFPNTHTSRLQGVAALREALKQNDFRAYDEQLLLELTNYTKVANDRGVEKYSAPEGMHDDLCVAAMRSQQIRQHVPGGGAFSRKIEPSQLVVEYAAPMNGW